LGRSSILDRIPTLSIVGVRRAICISALVALTGAPAALADTTDSTNWAGYAAHGSGASFRGVKGSWIEPAATCTRGTPTYSSYWVGVGGYSQSSKALEQIGTEVDCTAGGKVTSSAWYELVPAPSTPIRLTVKPGDALQASVGVRGNAVTVSLYDATRGQGFRKTVRASVVDLSSAEWIVEAPSECISASSCQTLPLANFGSATFGSALAQASNGRTGAIASPMWQSTKINLRPDSRRFIVNSNSGPVLGIATPSALQPGGASFKVNYTQVPVAGGPVFGGRGASVRAGYILHPHR
jgi:hypothetical protein